MKALILAAGLGTRLRPITNEIPKCLVPIKGKTLLEYHLDRLQKFGVTDVCVNTHYLADKVENFVVKYRAKNSGINVCLSFEPELLGSAGTLKKNSDFFAGEDDFFVVYGDNLTNIDYGRLVDCHFKKRGVCTVAAYFEPHPESKGIIVFDKDDRILQFIEKPKKEQVISHDANGGIYVCNKKILKYLNNLTQKPLDFGMHLFPAILAAHEKMFVYHMDEYLLDVGTVETYALAEKEVGDIKF